MYRIIRKVSVSNMFYQPKELWQYESALFYCDAQEIRAYMLRRLNTVSTKSRDMFVTVEEVANAHMKELEAIYPVLNVDKAKDADESFKSFIQNVFDKKVVSSVYLTGEGFENNWYPNSLKVLCNGRRAFLGNNLYSKGACYSSMRYEIRMMMVDLSGWNKDDRTDLPAYENWQDRKDGIRLLHGEHTGMRQTDSGK